MLLRWLQRQWVAIWSLGFWICWGTGLQAATENTVSPPVLENLNPPSELTPQIPPVAQPENRHPDPDNSVDSASEPLHYQLAKQPFVIAAPDKFNPNLRVEDALPSLTAAPDNFNPDQRLQQPPPPPPSPTPPSPQPSPPPATTPAVQPAIDLENIQTDFRYDSDNFGRENLFIEPTAQFRLSNGNIIRFKTGFNYFEQPGVDSVSNIPLIVGYETKIDKITLQAGVGVDLFNRLPTALNFNAKVDVPILPKVTLSGVLEQGPYKFNAEVLENQITAWRYGPNLYWQIDRKTYLFSLLRLGNYNDGNFEQQSFSRIERKFGQFYMAANLFNWSYTHDLQEESGYFSPPDFIVYTGEVGWEGQIFDFLRCRVAASLGQQRLNGQFAGANSYEARCTTKLSPNVDVDFGYVYSNVQNRQTGGSAYNNDSFRGQLRVSF